ncbi:unnamed protein product, partial [Dibothriocephalus latus]
MLSAAATSMGDSLKPSSSPSLPHTDCRNLSDQPTTTTATDVPSSTNPAASEPLQKAEAAPSQISEASLHPAPPADDNTDVPDSAGTESKEQVRADQEARPEGDEDEDEDAGDSEFEVPADSRAEEDDDSIAADEDIADEEEVNSLMRVRLPMSVNSIVSPAFLSFCPL